MNIPTPSETEKAKDQWIRCRLVTTDNEKYVKRGQALIIRDDPQRHEEVMVANRNKVGAPFQYAESLFAALAAVKSMTGLPYRHLQGMLIETLGDWNAPCYTTIYRRFQALEVKRNGSVFTVTGGGTVPIRLAVDSTGLKQHNRGEWIRHKWKVRRGFVKLHVMVDVNTKRILAVQVTDDRTGDSPMLIPLLDEALEAVARTGQAQDSAAGPADAGCCLYGDAAYASRSNVTACGDRGVDSRIKLRVNSMARGKGTGDAWGIAVRKQLGGSADSHVWKMSDDEKRRFGEEWKKKVEYGKRWLVEIVFSAFKRMFGEHLYSLKWKNMVQEVRIKVATYNKLVDMGAGVV